MFGSRLAWIVWWSKLIAINRIVVWKFEYFNLSYFLRWQKSYSTSSNWNLPVFLIKMFLCQALDTKFQTTCTYNNIYRKDYKKICLLTSKWFVCPLHVLYKVVISNCLSQMNQNYVHKPVQHLYFLPSFVTSLSNVMNKIIWMRLSAFSKNLHIEIHVFC